ncbi:hypothetical protein GM661_06640 [Iocasia frigidifontis]|uniref:GT-D fold-like domain-containing protein n=1 Tax=Iocasia fonsfrigidae TaxID=2682810 RepID=A0A8A7KC80_9FIRM|nr:hypothetical protein GM661_06640 [Iocasia fonsfrigidae]
MINSNHFHNHKEVADKIRSALANHKGLSLVRIGNGEAIAIGHDLFNIYSSRKYAEWLEYAGIRLPDEIVRDMVLKAIAEADIVGFRPDATKEEAQLEKVLELFNIKTPYICTAVINWELYKNELLVDLFRDKRVFLVGRVAKEAAKIMKKQGFNITDTLELEGFYDLNRVFYYAKNKVDLYDVALISAGIPAVVLSYWIADRLKKVAIDFGHVMNYIVDNNFGPDQLAVAERKWKNNKKIIPLYFSNILLIKMENSSRIYLYLHGFKHAILNIPVMEKYNLNFMEPLILDENMIKRIPDGPEIK